MIRIEFDTIDEYIEFMETYNPNDRKDEVTTVEYAENQRWLKNNCLEQSITDLMEEIGVNASNIKTISDGKISILTDRIKQVENVFNEQEDLINSQGKLIDEIMGISKRTFDLVSENTPKNVKAEIIDPARNYSESYTIPYKVKKLYKDGYFLIGRRKSVFTIKDVLKLRKIISEIEGVIPYSKISKKFKFGFSTVAKLCYNIEAGVFDKYINEYEQKQANEFYSKNISTLTVNNPEKRKELMGMG